MGEELSKYGKNVQLIYGGGSIKKNGIYEQVMELLKANGKVVTEDGGVMPNPTAEKLAEGVRIARENQVDLLLAVGGVSCCDYANAVSVSVHCEDCHVWIWGRTHAPAFQPENAGEEKTVPHHHQSISAAVADRGIFQVQETAV